MTTDPRTTPPAPGSLAWAHEVRVIGEGTPDQPLQVTETDPRLVLIHNLLQVETDLAEVQRDREDVKTTLRRMEETIDKLQNAAAQIRDQLAVHLGFKDEPEANVPLPYLTGRSQ